MDEKCKYCGQEIPQEIIKVEGYFWDYEKLKWIKKIDVPKEIRDAEEGNC